MNTIFRSILIFPFFSISQATDGLQECGPEFSSPEQCGCHVTQDLVFTNDVTCSNGDFAAIWVAASDITIDFGSHQLDYVPTEDNQVGVYMESENNYVAFYADGKTGGIGSGFSRGLVLRGNYCTVEGLHLSSELDSEWSFVEASGDNNLIQNNYFLNGFVYLHDAKNTILHGNIFKNEQKNMFGDFHKSAISIDKGCEKTIVSSNVISGYTQGIDVFMNDDSIIKRNCIYDNKRGIWFQGAPQKEDKFKPNLIDAVLAENCVSYNLIGDVTMNDGEIQNYFADDVICANGCKRGSKEKKAFYDSSVMLDMSSGKV